MFHTATAAPAADAVGLLLGAAVAELVARRSGSLLVAVGAGLAVVAATSYAAGLM